MAAILSKIRAAIILLLAAGLVVTAYAGYQLFTEKPDHETSVSRATGTTDDGWQQVTYRGVKVDVPAEWARLDASECEVQWERWGAAGVDPCGDLGLVFRASSSFDADAGPGVQEAAPSAALPDGGWQGYVTRGDVVIVVMDADQAVVRRVLESVSETI